MNIVIRILGILIAFFSLRTGGKSSEEKEKKEGVSVGKVLLIVVVFWYVTKQFQNSQKEDLEATAPTDITVIQAQSIYKALHPFNNPTGLDGLDYNALLQVADEILKQNVERVTANYRTLYGITLGSDIAKELNQNQQIEFYGRLNKTTQTVTIKYNKGDELYARKDLKVLRINDTTKVETTVKKNQLIGEYLGVYFKVKATGKVYLRVDLDWSLSEGYVDITEVYKQ
ncbi:MAG: hypothetical protein MUF58_11815 [Arcicella sp.]|jgi:uncharacterized Zn ribbon protein|nr:hypothetical protein [Arcicella sp.]